MMKLNKELTKDLIKTTDTLRKKYKALRNDKEAFDFQLKETFEPITKPLNELVKKSKKHHSIHENPNSFKSPVKKIKRQYEAEETEQNDDDEEVDDKFITPGISSNLVVNIPPKTSLSTPRSKSDRSERKLRRNLVREFVDQIDLRNYEEIPRKYMDLFVNNSKTIDDVYGVHTNNGKLQIGDKDFKINGQNIEINNKTYKGTSGLFELIFKKIPSPALYNKEDLNNYKNILLSTNAYRRNHNSKNQIMGHKGYKYTQIISKLFKDTSSSPTDLHIGHGVMHLSNKEKDYIYWDDPNELVVRLRLLISSHQAGHNNHSNEIVSIIEELKEANIIE